ncbi:TetR/AcrR family transcriptional regulator [Streptomyces sp. AC602_WCS936]|uniref:TetR/AcrR family transcriptional regulator n=1 Tax=Streptomyces sp. AC602_WCS936 TaxID=2823685 RepID=UPI0020B7A0EF|nr:TetR family transcriptional regulator [Streptomyces sp. AC602_WCS936]
MVRRNDQRRAALVDAAIEVLAAEGARGLTFRAVDTAAAVPAGTASNYFANRDDLLTQAGARVYERLHPDEATITRQRTAGRDRDTYVALMRELVDRIASFRTGYLALLELRLEATRRPGLRAVLTERVRADVRVGGRRRRAHRGAGQPPAPHAVLMGPARPPATRPDSPTQGPHRPSQPYATPVVRHHLPHTSVPEFVRTVGAARFLASVVPPRPE